MTVEETLNLFRRIASLLALQVLTSGCPHRVELQARDPATIPLELRRADDGVSVVSGQSFAAKGLVFGDTIEDYPYKAESPFIDHLEASIDIRTTRRTRVRLVGVELIIGSKPSAPVPVEPRVTRVTPTRVRMAPFDGPETSFGGDSFCLLCEGTDCEDLVISVPATAGAPSREHWPFSNLWILWVEFEPVKIPGPDMWLADRFVFDIGGDVVDVAAGIGPRLMTPREAQYVQLEEEVNEWGTSPCEEGEPYLVSSNEGPYLMRSTGYPRRVRGGRR